MLMRISEIEEKYKISHNTLLGWEKAGRLSPIKTLGGHRRYAEEQIREVLGFAKRIQVCLLNRESHKSCISYFVRIPNEGDIVWLNQTCFKVDKVVHAYTASPDQVEPNWFEPEIYLVKATQAEIDAYDSGDKHSWQRESTAGFAE